MIRSDVLIVGAGPAGSATAALLARSGRTVLLLDQMDFPRDKPCGEYLSPGAMLQLGQYVPELMKSIHCISSMVVTSDSGAALRYSLPTPGGSLRRTLLDQQLLLNAAAAGAQFSGRARVDRVETKTDSTVLHGRLNGEPQSWEASWLVVADGYHSRIVRQLGWDRGRPGSRVSRTFHAPARSSDAMEMHTQRAHTVGYGPQGAEANITVVMNRPTRGAGRSSAPDMALKAVSSIGSAADLGKPTTTACGPRRSVSPGTGRILVIGDAARFVDPFTGEGIYSALKGASDAATALLDFAAPLRVIGRFQQLRRDDLERRYRLCGLIYKALEHPFLRDLALRGLASSPPMAARLLNTVADLEAPQIVLNPRFVLDLLCCCITAS